VNPDSYYGTELIALSPGPGGAHNWAPMSFNPLTGLVSGGHATRTLAATPREDDRPCSEAAAKSCRFRVDRLCGDCD
jgi:hypothetical protein